MLEIVRAAAAVADPGLGAFELADVTWLKPLFVTGGGAPARLSVSRDNGELQFTIASSDDGPCRHDARAGLDPGGRGGTGSRPWTLPPSRARLGRPVEGLEVYRLFERLGFVYGPRYRVIGSVASDGEEVLARLASDGGSDVAPRHWVAPALLDGAIQSAIGLSFGPRGLPEGTVIPASVGRVRFHRPIGPSALVHIRRVERTGDPVGRDPPCRPALRREWPRRRRDRRSDRAGARADRGIPSSDAGRPIDDAVRLGRSPLRRGLDGDRAGGTG